MKNAIWLQILSQFFFPILSSFSPAVYASAVNSPFAADREGATPLSSDTVQATSSSDGSTVPFSSGMDQAATLLSSGHSVDTARSMAVGMASGQLQKWLSGIGTARIQLNIDRHGNWSHSSGDLLVPLYDNGQSLLFVQGGIRKPSDRLTANLGYGVRTFWQNGWMYGGNVFYDNDFTGHNRRVGIGGEAWRDYFRLSANTYLGTTQWHTSRDFDGTWQEKPSDGYDVRAEGWLPTYPQLGGKLIWEQYYGEQVALFDKDRLQHNPHAVTAGIEYTPIPLITFGVDHRQGRGTQDTQLALGFHWNFSHDWRWQFNSANVDIMRTLSGSRYELVNRNNEIVLQYRKNPDEIVAHLALAVITDNSPADGVTRNVLQVLATNRNGQPVRNAPIEWSAQSDGSVSLATASTVTDNNGLAAITLSSTKEQTVPVTVQSGSAIAIQNSHFIGVEVSHIALAVTHDNAVADGHSTDSIVATLTDSNGRPVTGQTVKWDVPAGVTLVNDVGQSDKNGMVTVQLTSTVAGNETISAVAGSKNISDIVIVHFVGNAASAKIGSLIITTDGSLADGKTVNVAQVTVTDANGNALAGQTVSWKSSRSTVTFGSSAVTDSNGRTTVSYTDTVSESLTLTASLVNGNSATIDSRFVIGEVVLKDLSVTSGAQASGNDANTATVIVTDVNNNVLSGQTVTFSVTGSAKLATASVSTDGDGKAQVTLTDEVAETIQVTAKLSNGSSKTKDSTFTVDIDNTILSVTSTTGAIADGSSTNTATVILKDKNNSPLSGQSITLSVSGNAKLSAASATTDSNGQVQVSFTDTVAETVTVTASVKSEKTASAQAVFITYTITDLSTSATSLKADGNSSATLTATVKDGNGTIVADVPVTFSVTGSAVLSATTVKTNSSGQAQVTLTDTTGETVTVTAKTKDNINDAGKTQSITFTESAITGVTVYGTDHTFVNGSNFPETGYAGARMVFVVDDSSDAAANYTWSSNRSWVKVEDGSNEVVMIASTYSDSTSDAPDVSERTVTITATPKTGGKALTYTFTLKKWYERSARSVSISRDSNLVGSACNSIGGTVPSASDLTDGTVSVVGKLLGEWRDSKSLEFYYFVAESLTAWRAKEDIVFVYSSGEISASSSPGSSYVMCLIP